jgi:hypothetical protein
LTDRLFHSFRLNPSDFRAAVLQGVKFAAHVAEFDGFLCFGSSVVSAHVAEFDGFFVSVRPSSPGMPPNLTDFVFWLSSLASLV